MAGKFYLVVKADIGEGTNRDAFDHWYATDHMPKALTSMGAEKGWRFWSASEPRTHYAVYRFADRERPTAIKATADGPGTPNTLEFNRAWPGVPRTREVLEIFDEVRPG